MGACCHKINNNNNNINANNINGQRHSNTIPKSPNVNPIHNTNIHPSPNTNGINTLKKVPIPNNLTNQVKTHVHPTQIAKKPSKPIKQVTAIKAETKITIDDVDQSIHKWTEKTKKYHKKSGSPDNNTNHAYSYDESEITKDFADDNNDILRSFSEITSTLHLTNITRDFMSKLRFQNNIISLNAASGSLLYDVLEDLHESNNSECINILKTVPILNLNDKSNTSITLQQQKGSIDNCSYRENIIINRSDFNEVNDCHDDIYKNPNNALILTNALDSIISDKEDEEDNNISIDQKNYLCESSKIDINQAIAYTKKKHSNATSLSNQGFNVNGMEVSHLYSKESLNHIEYPSSINGTFVEWKSIPSNESIDLQKNYNNVFTLKQGFFDDSSLLAAMMAISNFDHRFQNSHFDQIIKLDQTKKQYDIKVWLNGRENHIKIDDKIPYYSNISETNTNNSHLLSTCSNKDNKQFAYYMNIIEKVFLIMNRWDCHFISNFSIEIYHLIGWVPEYYKLSKNIIKETFWNQLCNNYFDGNILVCFACLNVNDPIKDNNNQTYSKSERIYLNGYYPVLNIKIDNEKKELCMACTKGDLIPSKGHVDSTNSQLFYISYEDAVDIFSSVYLGWNPIVYRNTTKLISSYAKETNTSKFNNEEYSLEHNTQFLMTIPPHRDDIPIKVLLTKHIESFGNHEAISCLLFKYEGYPIIYHDIDLLKTFDNSGREIISDTFSLEANDETSEYVLVILKKDSLSNKSYIMNTYSSLLEKPILFTLQLFTQIEIKVCELPKREYYSTAKKNDVWNISNHTDKLFNQFLKFPHYKMALRSGANDKETDHHIQIKLETAVLSQIMLCVINSPNHLIKTSPKQFNEKKTPCFFSNSFSYIEVNLPNGEYTILCLSNNNDNINKMTIECISLKNDNCQISLTRHNPIPKYPNLKKFFGEWTYKNNIGEQTINYLLNFRNPSYEFTITKHSKMTFYLKEHSELIDFNQDCPQIYVSLYKIKQGDQLSHKLVYDGKEGICSYWGFMLEDIDLEPGRYVLVCLNSTVQQLLKYEGLIYSSSVLNNFDEYILLTPRKYSMNILSKWNDKQNTTYRIKSLKKSYCDFVINTNKSVNLALTIIDSEDNDTNKDLLINQKQLPHTQNQMYIMQKVLLEPGKVYILIPFSFTSTHYNYDIKIFSDEELSITEVFQNVTFI